MHFIPRDVPQLSTDQPMPRKTKKLSHFDPLEVLEGKVAISCHDLIRLIHRVNPTKENLPEKEAALRYQIKSRLQSQLVERFHDRLIVQYDPQNPEIVGFTIQYYDEDACHAVISDLDEKSRSWVWMQVDTSHRSELISSATAVGLKNGTQPTLSSSSTYLDGQASSPTESSSPEELLIIGRKALDDYDYDGSEEYFLRAFALSHGAPFTAIPLLEYYVDHVAAYEKVHALVGALSATAKQNDEVKVLLALAEARCGHLDQALEHVDRLIHPRAAEVYLLCANAFVAQGRDQEAARLHNLLLSLEIAQLEPELAKLKDEIQKIQIKALEPLEAEMLRVWRLGDQLEALNLADKLLLTWPHNKAAATIRREYDMEMRAVKIASLLRQADEARDKAGFKEEVDCLKKAMDLGADGLGDRLEQARAARQDQMTVSLVAETVQLWADGKKREALLLFVALSEEGRRHVATACDAPHFHWISRIVSSHSLLKPEKMIEAVLALADGKEILQRGGDPSVVISNLQAHGKVLQALPEASDLLRQALSIVEGLKKNKMQHLLAQATEFLDSNDLLSARECLNGINADVLNPEENELFVAMKTKLGRLEKNQALYHSYTSESAKGNHFAARDNARLLAESVEPETTTYWQEKVREHQNAIGREWCFVCCDRGELSSYTDCSDMLKSASNSSMNLALEQGALMLVSAHDRWIFLWEFSLVEQQVKKIYLFRAPKKMTFPDVYVTQDEIWITGNDGYAVSFSTTSMEINGWYNLRHFIKDGCVVEWVGLFPKSRYAWINWRQLSEERVMDMYDVIDLEQWRVKRRVKAAVFPFPINAGGHFQVATAGWTTPTVQIYSEQGKPIANLSLAKKERVDVASLHPNGVNYCLLSSDDKDLFATGMVPESDESEDQSISPLILNVQPDPEGRFTPVILADSNGELVHQICTSFDDGIVFVCYLSTLGDSDLDHTYVLAAFTPVEHGFTEIYRMQTPQHLSLAFDEHARKVAAVLIVDGMPRAILLGRDEPRFDITGAEVAAPPLALLPRFKDYRYCWKPTGANNAMVLACTAQIQNLTAKSGLPVLVQGMKKREPDEIVAGIEALKRCYHFAQALELEKSMIDTYPDHQLSRMKQAEDFMDKEDWPQVVHLLQGINRGLLDDGTACHVCHLLGMGLFAVGDVGEALTVWNEGDNYERGNCELSDLIDYANISLSSREERIKRTAQSGVIRTLICYETVDAHLANGQWLEAISVMEGMKGLVLTDIQIGARFAESYLQLKVAPDDPRWFAKVWVLSLLVKNVGDTFARSNQVMPPFIEHWSEARLVDVAGRATDWLEKQPATDYCQ